MISGRFAAVDLGASGGRVVVAEVDRTRLQLTGLYRFPNRPVQLPDGLHWNILSLYGSVLDGLTAAGREGALMSIGVDTWAVDFGLLDAQGSLIGNPYHYRDPRHSAGVEAIHGRRTHAELYALNGLQFLPFNTIYQLGADWGSQQLTAARTLLLVPDLIAYWLTGAIGAEVTNASTTGLLDPRSHTWSPELCDLALIPPALLPELRAPGDVVGTLTIMVAEQAGLARSTPVTAVGSHDTASAVVAVPMDPERAAYISLGTWGLVGVELEKPILTDESRRAGFTNELGVDGRVRYLRNVMGLWLLQECLRSWGRNDLPTLLGAAAELPPDGPRFDVDDARFLPPGDMPARVAAAVEEIGGRPLQDPASVVRCVVDSLTDRLAQGVVDAARLSGRDVEVVHVVGGGSQNSLLCQLLANKCGLPVVAGPVEATALGNVLVQARTLGVLSGSLEALRDLVRRTHPSRTFTPRVDL